jgi:hypothetical protein
MENGTWSYPWDTSVILGTLKPGNYTVHVVSSPVERMRFAEGDSALTGITFRAPAVTPAETPVSPVLPFAALGIAMIFLVIAGRTRE